MRILSRITSSAYIAAPQLLPLIAFKQVFLSVKYGNSNESIYAYATYGLILCGVIGDIVAGYQFGELALKLLERSDSKQIKTSTLETVYGFIKHWRGHLKETLIPLLEAYKNGRETGDLEFASYSALIYCYHSYLMGKELTEVEREIANYSHATSQLQQETASNFIKIYWQSVLNLRGHSESGYRLIGEAYDEKTLLPICLAVNNRTAILTIYLNKMMLCYLFEEYHQACEFATLTERYLDGMPGTILIPVFYFYAALSQLSVAEYLKLVQKIILLKQIGYKKKKLKRWADFAPENYLHKYTLVKAELNRIIGKDVLAMECYDRAISLAKENEYIHEAAIAYELAAKFYLSKGKELTARTYMQEARYCYQIWGATAKVQDLDRRYSQLLIATQPRIQDSKATRSVTTTTGSGSNLDITTVLKATQAISGEIMLDKLLYNLMKIIIENAGVQRGYLILLDREKDGENPRLLIEASGTINNEEVAVWQSIPITNCQMLPESIINYVARGQESVVLNDATKEGKFTNDVYIIKNNPKSILCVPLINQGKLVSIVYLENNLTVGAFTKDRLEILQLLSGQAAISIQNAKLYTEVRENESRLAQLNKAYERFVPGQFLQYLEKSSIIDVELGDQVQLEMSVLFSDIRDFTTLSESMTPEENFKFINSYLSRMEPAIAENSGFIDKYIGDAIMALFSGEADNAVKAGISMLHRLIEYNQHRANSGYKPIKNGIGINTGFLMLGTVGGQNRMDSTVISDAVNLASRGEVSDVTNFYRGFTSLQAR